MINVLWQFQQSLGLLKHYLRQLGRTDPLEILDKIVISSSRLEYTGGPFRMVIPKLKDLENDWFVMLALAGQMNPDFEKFLKQKVQFAYDTNVVEYTGGPIVLNAR